MRWTKFNLLLLGLMLCAGQSLGQQKTVVADKLVGPDGAAVSGSLVVTALHTFQSADGYTVFAQSHTTARVGVDGAFSVSLIPNAGSSPSGSSYQVQYTVQSHVVTETWAVPVSASPITLSAVRTLPAPTPSLGQPYDAGMFWPGTITQSSQLLARIVFTRTVTFPAGLASSEGAAQETATNSTVITLARNGTAFGTCTFGAGASSCSFAAVSSVVFNPGDTLTALGPATPDATLGDIAITLAGTR